MSQSGRHTTRCLRRFACLLALAIVASVPVWAGQDRPDGWKVEVTSQKLFPKHSLYAFTVSVRDAAGKLVDRAQVYVRLHSSGPTGERLIPTRRTGKGRYEATAWLQDPRENPRDAQVVIEPGDAR